MSFINNPVVSSLAGAIGLGGLTSQGSNPLVASAVPRVAPKASAPNQPEYKQARFFDPRAPQGARGGAPSGMPTEPGAMSPDVQNNPTVMDLLQHFGVHPQQEIDPGLFIHNAHAWAAHPVMSGVLDGLLGGLANTKGSDTVGEGLSNVAQGLEATHDQKVAHVNAQLQMPYQQAMTVASLQDQVGKQSLQEAQMRHDNSMSDYYDSILPARQKVAETNVAGREAVATTNKDAKVAAVNAKPSKLDQDPVFQGELRKIVGNRDTTQQPITADEREQAALSAGSKTSVSKAAGGIAASHATVKDKQAVKATMSGGSATAGANAPGYIDPTRKAQISAAEQDLKSFDTNKGYIPGDTSKGEPAVIFKSDPIYNKKRAALVAKRDSLVGGSAPAPSTSKYSANNPFATKQ